MNKHDHRVARIFLKGQLGDSINFIMTAAGFNYKKLMKKLKAKVLWRKIKINDIKLRMLFEKLHLNFANNQNLRALF